MKTLSDRVIIVKLVAKAIADVSTQKGILVFDAGMSNSSVGKFGIIIEKEFNRSYFAYLVNTHSHPDRTAIFYLVFVLVNLI